jgi:hypothetical protein
MDLSRSISIARRRVSWYLAAKVIASLFVLAYATSFAVTPTVYHAENGGAITITGNLTATDKGINKTTVTLAPRGVTCSQTGSNVTFTTGTPGTANTNLTANHYVYSIQINATDNTPLLSCFSVTLTITPAGASPAVYVLNLATGSSVDPNQAIYCEFDIGSSLPTTPYSFSVAIQQTF